MYLLFYIIALAGLVAAGPVVKIPPALSSGLAKPELIVSGSSPVRQNRNYTSDEVHANVLAYHPQEWIVSSDSLHKYLNDNIGANHTIYISEQQKWISMSSVYIKTHTGSHKRQGSGTSPCFGYTNTWVAQTQSWWNSWSPASGCLYTGNSAGGGSSNINWSYSLSISETAGLSWDIIQSVLSASIGFTVTQTWSNGGSDTCNVPAYSVGQIWEQNYIGWGWFWSEGCESCDYGGGCGGQFGSNPTADGGATAPAASTAWGTGVNVGCSTGSDKVQC